MKAVGVILLICICGTIAGPPGPLITLSSEGSVYTLGWIGTTENSIGYQFLMNITNNVQVANPGHILTIKNDTSVLFPSYVSGNTQIFACSWKNLRCSAGCIIPGYSINTMSFDENNSQLWFVGLSQNQYEVAMVTLNSFDQPNSLVPLIFSVFGNSTSVSNLQGTLGPLQYYVSYTLEGINYAYTVNRSNYYDFTTTFQNGFAPVSMIYNANSLTNLTSLYQASANSYKTCSPDFPKGNAEYPLNATPFPNATPVSDNVHYHY